MGTWQADGDERAFLTEEQHEHRFNTSVSQE